MGRPKRAVGLIEIAGAFAASAALFVAAAAAIPLRDDTLLIVVWGLLLVGVAGVAAKRLGPLYGVPFAIAVGVALDSYYIPPTRPFGPHDRQNVLVVAVYVGLGVMVGALADASRRERGRLAREQAALRRVATLVARGVDPAEVFACAADEMGDLLGADTTRIARSEPDGTETIVADTSHPGEPHDARVDGSDRLNGDRASLASPVVVGGRVWGAIIVSSRSVPFPPGAEQRIADFTELLAIAIGNADGRAQLTESRARIVAAADETRRRLERDLHDGVQQRLVSLALAVREAAMLVPPDLTELDAFLSRAVDDINHVTDEVREIARGIHPAILSQGGLAPALRTLARRSGLPVTVTNETEDRLPEQVEVAAYYVAAEALTNVVKHARASAARVEVHADAAAVRLRVSDDGVGGADPSRGSGLIGLSDRVEALGGSIAVESLPGEGTSLEVCLPTRVASVIG